MDINSNNVIIILSILLVISVGFNFYHIYKKENHLYHTHKKENHFCPCVRKKDIVLVFKKKDIAPVFKIFY